MLDGVGQVLSSDLANLTSSRLLHRPGKQHIIGLEPASSLQACDITNKDRGWSGEQGIG
jgi:hypothetical protein